MSPYVTQYIFWSFTSGGAEMFMHDGMEDVYLRWFRLHSAGVSLCIPPVALAELPALFHPKILDIYLRCFGYVYLRWGRDIYA